MKLSLLKESIPGENRVALSPEIVKKLVAKGFEIAIVSGAGEHAYFTDEQYQSAGASIVSEAEAMQADILVKVRKPTSAEVKALPQGKILIAHVESCETDEILKTLSLIHI